MILTVQMTPAVARDLATGHAALAQSRRLHSIVSELGLQLKPLHPGTTDPDLATRFYVNAPDQHTAEEARRRIEESGVVEGVYVKPPDAAPF